MTIRTTVLCDTCDAVYAPINQLARWQLVHAAHTDGWTSTRGTNGMWKNFCPECTEKENAA